MPKFQITHQGATYEIDAPDENKALEAFQGFTVQPAQFETPKPPLGAVVHTTNSSSGDMQADASGKLQPAPNAAAEAAARMQSATPSGMLADRVQATASGIPVAGGLIPRAVAAGLSAVRGTPYDDEYNKLKTADQTFSTDRPVESTGYKLLGGVGAGLMAGPAIAGALGTMPRLGALATATGGGMAVGAADGATRGDDVPDAIKQALLGGTIGGVAGAAAPVIGKGVGMLAQGIGDRINQARNLSGIGLSPPSAAILQRALEADGTLGGQGAANIASAGPRAMVADAGPNATATLDAAIQRGGQGATLAQQAISDRASAAAGDVTGALDAHLGAPQGVQSTTTALRTGTAAARGNAYDTAYATKIDYSDPKAAELRDLLKRVPDSAIAAANKLMEIEGVPASQIITKPGPAAYENLGQAVVSKPTTISEKLPNVRQWDYITRGLNETADAADGQGKLGGTTDVGRATRNLSGQIRGKVRDLVPEYGNALDTAAHPIEQRNALQFGAKLMSPSVPRDVVDETLSNMGQAERNSVKQGIRATIDETIANVKRTMTDPNVDQRQAVQALKNLSSDAARSKIERVIGPNEAKSLFGKLDEASRAFDLKANTTVNSKTFARTNLADTVKDATAPGPLGTLLQGKPIEAGRLAIQNVLGTGKDAQLAKADRVYSEIAKALTEPRGQQAQDFLATLQRAQQVQGKNKALADALAGRTGGALYGASLPAGTVYDQRRAR